MRKMSAKPPQDSDLTDRPSFDDSKSLVETIFQAFPDLLFHLDLEGRIVDYVAGDSSALYTTPENFLGHKMVEVLPEGAASLFAHAIAETIKSGQISSLEYDLTTAAGFRSYQAKCIRRSSLHIIVVVRDITSIKDTEALARKQLETMKTLYVELGAAYQATVEGLSRALELRDRETQGHTRRVTEMTLALARQMGLSDVNLASMRQGALLHDIGKMGIPDAILLKPGSLTPQEWAIMRQHTLYAYELLSQIEYLKPALDIPLSHHEKWDGTGYPHGLKGQEIPLAARIFSVVDVYDALRSDRPYRPAWSREKTLEYIQSQTGIHFDPAVVEIFIQWVNANNVPGLIDAPVKV
jgi:putative nucleotidyltransferase with HDIG domain